MELTVEVGIDVLDVDVGAAVDVELTDVEDDVGLVDLRWRTKEKVVMTIQIGQSFWRWR